MALLQKGSSGSKVKELQELLNGSGYGLDVDGVFGDKTYNAVRQYQKANGLGVDGIVGDQTWGSLTKNGTTANPGDTNAGTAVTPSATTPLGTTYNPNETTGNKADLGALEGGAPTFTESQAYKDAMSSLQQHQNAKPGAYQSSFADRLNGLWEQIAGQGGYQSQYQGQIGELLNQYGSGKYESPYGGKIEEIYNQIMARPKFEYDFNVDPLYQQYKDQYIAQGNRAMQDAMASAAALTGGYGNSYATMAGQQAYQQHLAGLNNVIPELLDAAYGRYQDEGNALLQQMQILQGLDETAYGRYQDEASKILQQMQILQGMDETAYGRYQDAANALLQQYQLLQGQEKTEYDRYRDETGDWYTDLEYLTGMAGDQWNRDNTIYQTALDKYLADRDYYYGKTQDELAQENYLKELALAQASKSSGGGGGGSNRPSGGNKPETKPDQDMPEEEDKLTVAEAQQVLYQIAQSDGLTAASREMKKMLEDGSVEGEDVESKLKYALSMMGRR